MEIAQAMNIPSEIKAEAERLMWKYLDALKAKDQPEQKRLYRDIMALCGVLEAAGEDVERVR